MFQRKTGFSWKRKKGITKLFSKKSVTVPALSYVIYGTLTIVRVAVVHISSENYVIEQKAQSVVQEVFYHTLYVLSIAFRKNTQVPPESAQGRIASLCIFCEKNTPHVDYFALTLPHGLCYNKEGNGKRVANPVIPRQTHTR